MISATYLQMAPTKTTYTHTNMHQNIKLLNLDNVYLECHYFQSFLYIKFFYNKILKISEEKIYSINGTEKIECPYKNQIPTSHYEKMGGGGRRSMQYLQKKNLYFLRLKKNFLNKVQSKSREEEIGTFYFPKCQ